MINDLKMTAALYALGILDTEERRDFQLELEQNSELRAEVEWWELRLVPLEPPTPAIEPDPSSWAAITARLGFDAGNARTVHSDTGVWIPYLPGVDIKYIEVDPVSAERTALLRMQPGSSAPQHYNDQTEHCIVIEGEIRIDEHHLKKGDLHIAPRGSDHQSISSDGGALIMLSWRAKGS